MKKFEELTPEDCQTFLDILLENDAEFKKIVSEPKENELMGIEYSINSEGINGYVTVSNPELLSWMYQNEVDITTPLKQLKYEYNDLDETNSVLFEYAMEIGKIINSSEYDEIKYSKIYDTHKQLINRL